MFCQWTRVSPCHLVIRPDDNSLLNNRQIKSDHQIELTLTSSTAITVESIIKNTFNEANLKNFNPLVSDELNSIHGYETSNQPSVKRGSVADLEKTMASEILHYHTDSNQTIDFVSEYSSSPATSIRENDSESLFLEDDLKYDSNFHQRKSPINLEEPYGKRRKIAENWVYTPTSAEILEPIGQRMYRGDTINNENVSETSAKRRSQIDQSIEPNVPQQSTSNYDDIQDYKYKTKGIEHLVIEKKTGRPVAKTELPGIIVKNYTKDPSGGYKCKAQSSCKFKSSNSKILCDHVFTELFYIPCPQCNALLTKKDQFYKHVDECYSI